MLRSALIALGITVASLLGPSVPPCKAQGSCIGRTCMSTCFGGCVCYKGPGASVGVCDVAR